MAFFVLHLTQRLVLSTKKQTKKSLSLPLSLCLDFFKSDKTMSISSASRTRALRLQSSNLNDFISLAIAPKTDSASTLLSNVGFIFPNSLPSSNKAFWIDSSSQILFLDPPSPSVPSGLIASTITGKTDNLVLASNGAGSPVLFNDAQARQVIQVSDVNGVRIRDEIPNTLASFSASSDPGAITIQANRNRPMFFEVGGKGDFWFNTQATGNFRFSVTGTDVTSIDNTGKLTTNGVSINGAVVPLNVYTHEVFNLTVINPQNPFYTSGTTGLRALRLGNMVVLSFFLGDLVNAANTYNIGAGGFQLDIMGVPRRYLRQSPQIIMQSHKGRLSNTTFKYQVYVPQATIATTGKVSLICDSEAFPIGATLSFGVVTVVFNALDVSL